MTPELTETDPERDPVDLLADEFAMRCRRGETPSIAEYIRRYPEYAEQIEELFPSVALLEQLGSRPENDVRPVRQGSLPPHHRIGDFEILREIGRGGMGVVYEAVQQSLHRTVAVKVLNTASLHSENQAKRFEREAQAAAQLHHTNIVPVFGVGEQEGLRYYVMQRIHGLGLDAVLVELDGRAGLRLSPDGRLAPPDAHSVSAQALAGVLIAGDLSTSSSGPLSPGRLHGSESSPNTRFSAQTDVPTEEAGSTTRGRPSTDDGSDKAEHATAVPVPSSLILRDEPVRSGVRSSLILREDMSTVRRITGASDATESTPAKGKERSHSFGKRYWRNISRIGMQVAAGLQYAHSQGTLHRDIKPANILLDTDGTAWIADFGLAKVLEAENVTHTGDVVGTLRYMAPEQFHGTAHARSDLYSLGLTLYELLTLRPAYDETDRQKLVARKLTPHDPPSLRKWARDIPRDLETIVHKCLAYEAEERYASAGALLADLQAFVDDRPIRARKATSVERFWRWCRRNPAVAALSSTVALLLLLTAALTSAGYVQQRQLAVAERQRAADERQLHQEADEAREKYERIAQIAFQAFDNIGQSFISDDVIGTIELDDEDSDEQLQIPAFSPETAAIMEKLRSSFDEFATVAGEDQRFLDYAAKADLRAGELHLRLNQWEQAEAAFRRAIGLHEQFEDASHDAETNLRLAKLYNGLGIACGNLREWDEKWKAQQRALSLLSEDPSRPEMQFELARTYYLMGCRFQGRMPPIKAPATEGARGTGKRVHFHRTAAGPASRMHVPNLPPQPPRSLNDSEQARSRLGHREAGLRHGPGRHFAGHERELENRRHLQHAATLFADLVTSHPEVSEYQYWLALCYLETAKQDPRAADADDSRMRAVAILEELVAEHPNKPDYLYQLSEAYELRYDQLMGRQGRGLRLRESEATEEQLGLIENDLRQAVQVSDHLLAQQPHVPGYAISYQFLLMRLVDVLRSQGNYREALGQLNRLHEARKAFSDRFPDLEHFARRFDPENDPLREYLRANMLVGEGRLEEARAVLQSLTDRIESFERERAEDNGLPRHLQRHAAAVYRLLEQCLLGLGEDEQAAKVKQKLQSMTEEDNHRHRRSPPPRPQSPE